MSGSLDNKTRFSRKIFLLLMRFMFAISRKHARIDFRIAMLSPGKKENSAVAFHKIDEGLKLISEYDPNRYQQIQHDVKRIWVSTTPPYCAEWVSELQMCILDRAYLCRADVSPEQISSTIVHEATHAHLDRLEIKYTEESRVRIERICFESEIAFAKRLPDGEKLIKDAESRLKLPEAYWTNAEFQKRNLDAFSELGKRSTFARLSYPVVKWLVEMKRARRN